MRQIVKAFGIVLAAALASAVVLAPGAKGDVLTATSYPGTVNGLDTGTHEFTAAGGAVNCTHATFSGMLNISTTAQTITPVYEGCTAFGFVGATVTMNGCDYFFQRYSENSIVIFPATVSLVCPEGKEVTIDAGPCTVHIPAQTGLRFIDLTNGTSGGKADITAHAYVLGIRGTLTKSNFLCFFSAGEFVNGTYSGTTTVTGKNNGGEPQSIDLN